MRSLLYLLCLIVPAYAALHAYRVNFDTRKVLVETRQVRRDNANLDTEIRKLKGTWAYLNRPDRLQELNDEYYDKLDLVPILPSQIYAMKTLPPSLHALPTKRVH